MSKLKKSLNYFHPKRVVEYNGTHSSPHLEDYVVHVYTML